MSKQSNTKPFYNSAIPVDWEVSPLGDLVNKKVKWSFTGGPFGSNLKADDYTEIGVRIIQLQNIGDGEFLDKYKIYTSEEKANELLSCNIFPGEIILSKMGDPVARGCFIPHMEKRFLMASDGIRVVPDENRVDKFFLLSYINDNIFRTEAIKISTGSTRQRIGLDDLKGIKIPLPPLPEQKAIAQVLSTADAAIQNTEKLIAQKEIRKNWLMQQLLTGKKRLTGFGGEWKEYRIGDVGTIQTGNTPSKQESENWGGNFNWCTADDMKIKYVSKTIQKLSHVGWEKARIAKANSILVTCIASIGVNAITLIDTGFNQQINSITPSENFNVEFVYYLVDFSKNKLLEYAGAGALPMLNKSTFMSIVFSFPNIEEQNAIAQVLQAADKEISLLKAKAEKLREQKKGLMQVLLTGKKRLKID